MAFQQAVLGRSPALVGRGRNLAVEMQLSHRPSIQLPGLDEHVRPCQNKVRAAIGLTLRLPACVRLPSSFAVKRLKIEVVVELFDKDVIHSSFLGLQIGSEISKSRNVEQLALVDRFE